MQSVSEAIAQCKKVANTAKDGCPAETYALMTSLLEEIVTLSGNMNEEFPGVFNSIVKEILSAQEKNDLLKIADFCEFELVYVLENFQKQQAPFYL